MRKTVLVLVLWLCLFAGWSGANASAPAGSCSVTQAKRDVAAAKRAVARAEARLREARHVLSSTRQYVSEYGSGVGRWTRLARRVGWPWPQFPTLMYVINRESGGNPAVYNYQGSGCAGLLQLAPVHYQGRFDPTRPRANLSYGLKLWRGSGWQPWSL